MAGACRTPNSFSEEMAEEALRQRQFVGKPEGILLTLALMRGAPRPSPSIEKS